jgi:hypothetical protein
MLKPRNRVGERSDFVTSRDARLKNPLTGREPRGRHTAKQDDELAALHSVRSKFDDCTTGRSAPGMFWPGRARLARARCRPGRHELRTRWGSSWSPVGVFRFGFFLHDKHPRTLDPLGRPREMTEPDSLGG